MSRSKTCRICGETKQLDDFYKMAGMRDGHRNECKACNLAQKRRRYEADPDKHIAHVQAWRQSNREHFNAWQRRNNARPERKRKQRDAYYRRTFGISAHDVDALAARVDTVVSIAAPHHGTPMASLLASLSGQRFLRVLSLLTLHGTRIGSIPLPALVALIGYLPRIGRAQGPILTILDQVYSHLLREFDETRRLEIEEFFTATTSDQNLLPQLGVEAMQVFNAATTRRAATRYGCVVTQARPPTWRTAMKAGLSPSVQAVHALYRGLYQLAAGNELSLAPLHTSHIAPLRAVYGQLPSVRSNDAIVPTRSQLWGDLIHAVWADHLDVTGHFSGSDLTPPHVDWISTHSGFSRKAFEALWGDVVDYALASTPRT